MRVPAASARPRDDLPAWRVLVSPAAAATAGAALFAATRVVALTLIGSVVLGAARPPPGQDGTEDSLPC